MVNNDTTEATWSPDEVKLLNRWQQLRIVHPFTCGNNRMDEKHRAYQAEHGGDYGQLVATENGWVCPACGYTQEWAHQAMVNPKTLDLFEKTQVLIENPSEENLQRLLERESLDEPLRPPGRMDQPDR